MPATPKRASRQAREGTRFHSQVVAGNVEIHRRMRRLSQEKVAERMRLLGREWSRATVSEVEREGRHLNIDELGALALVLGVPIGDLLDPLGPDRKWTGIDTGGPSTLSAGAAHLWVRDKARLTFDGTRIGAEIYEHELPPSARGALRALAANAEPVVYEDLIEKGYDDDGAMILERPEEKKSKRAAKDKSGAGVKRRVTRSKEGKGKR